MKLQKKTETKTKKSDILSTTEDIPTEYFSFWSLPTRKNVYIPSIIKEWLKSVTSLYLIVNCYRFITPNNLTWMTFSLIDPFSVDLWALISISICMCVLWSWNLHISLWSTWLLHSDQNLLPWNTTFNDDVLINWRCRYSSLSSIRCSRYW